jgi:hypothetical protein
MSNYCVKLVINLLLLNAVTTTYLLASPSQIERLHQVGSMHALCLADLIFKFGPKRQDALGFGIRTFGTNDGVADPPQITPQPLLRHSQLTIH